MEVQAGFEKTMLFSFFPQGQYVKLRALLKSAPALASLTHIEDDKALFAATLETAEKAEATRVLSPLLLRTRANSGFKHSGHRAVPLRYHCLWEGVGSTRSRTTARYPEIRT